MPPDNESDTLGDLIGGLCFKICVHLIVDYHFSAAEAGHIVNSALEECGLTIKLKVDPDDTVVEKFD